MTRFLAPLALSLSLAIAGQATAQVGTAIFQENFNGLTLGPSVNERDGLEFRKITTVASAATIPYPNAYSHTGPAGWTRDNNFNNFGNVDLDNPNYAYGDIVGNVGMPNQNDAFNGVDEWEGWSFARKEFWITADDQRLYDFESTYRLGAVDSGFLLRPMLGAPPQDEQTHL